MRRFRDENMLLKEDISAVIRLDELSDKEIENLMNNEKEKHSWEEKKM
jgi:hypothetical protein